MTQINMKIIIGPPLAQNCGYAKLNMWENILYGLGI